MNKLTKTFIIGSALILSSCGTAGMSKSGSGIYISATDGIHTNNDVKSNKSGEACMYNIFGLVASGDISVAAAKEAGNITNVASIERTNLGINYPVSFAKTCTIIKGN
jgi:hypothetical protein